MAALIPALGACVSRMTTGERRLAERLEQNLDADYLLWYDVPIGPKQTHPDFVVMHPRRGLLILETKDWKLETIQRATRQVWDIVPDGQPKVVINPLAQARHCAIQVVNALERDPQLVQAAGAHQGKLAFPWGHGVVFTFDVKVLPALWFGVPQTRERLVLLASRGPKIALPIATHGPGKLPFATVKDWIGDLACLAAGGIDPVDPSHRAAELSELNMARIAATPEGGGRDNWPDHLLLDCHRNHKGHTDVYGRLAWNKPAAGLTTRCISYSNGRFGHPEQDRAISVREAACLQTFPTSFVFSGNLNSKARQVGNAVPPAMARSIGMTIQDHCAAHY